MLQFCRRDWGEGADKKVKNKDEKVGGDGAPLPNARDHLQIGGGEKWERKIGRGGLEDVSNIVEDMGGECGPRREP